MRSSQGEDYLQRRAMECPMGRRVARGADESDSSHGAGCAAKSEAHQSVEILSAIIRETPLHVARGKTQSKHASLRAWKKGSLIYRRGVLWFRAKDSQARNAEAGPALVCSGASSRSTFLDGVPTLLLTAQREAGFLITFCAFPVS